MHASANYVIFVHCIPLIRSSRANPNLLNHRRNKNQFWDCTGSCSTLPSLLRFSTRTSFGSGERDIMQVAF